MLEFRVMGGFVSIRYCDGDCKHTLQFSLSNLIPEVPLVDVFKGAKLRGNNKVGPLGVGNSAVIQCELGHLMWNLQESFHNILRILFLCKTCFYLHQKRVPQV